ncbi:MAG: histone deacetylase family protein [Candidatus Saliniplasma sp.]
MSKVPLFYHKDYVKYDFGDYHPFKSDRFSKFISMIESEEELGKVLKIIDSPRAENEDLCLVHTPQYIDRVERMAKIGGRLSPDTPVTRYAPEAARRIVGGSLEAAKSSQKYETIINFGGLHHAGREKGEGFCLFNDVAIAAQYLIDQGKKVCILDTDAHQGNGTMDIFYDSPKVLFISIHQDPRTIYPGKGNIEEIGHGRGEGFTVNIPLPRDSTIAEYHYSFQEVIRPLVKMYKPDVLIRNGGSDPHHSDSLTDLALDMKGLEYLGRSASEIADEVKAPHIDLLLSGYGLRVLEGWKAILKGVLDLDIDTPSDQKISAPGQEPKSTLIKTIDGLQELLEPWWDFRV